MNMSPRTFGSKKIVASLAIFVIFLSFTSSTLLAKLTWLRPVISSSIDLACVGEFFKGFVIFI
eukprot:snap_masked-scaffold_4-processed-gene-6.41-mRNA-1 protein AED:1.00 eAED:1.00 QI:0/0/0/0/1/1/2/0/62